MLTKDKIFIVCYININDIPENRVSEYLYNAEHGLQYLKDESAVVVILPVKNQNSHIECINPVLLDETQYEKARVAAENMQKAFQDFLDEQDGKKEGER